MENHKLNNSDIHFIYSYSILTLLKQTDLMMLQVSKSHMI